MPTYEYECTECGHRFERFQQMSAEPVKKCPECDGGVKRIIGTGAGIIFKGAGFHANDYKKTEPSCGRSTTCCGRNAPCNTKPCES